MTGGQATRRSRCWLNDRRVLGVDLHARQWTAADEQTGRTTSRYVPTSCATSSRVMSLAQGPRRRPAVVGYGEAGGTGWARPRALQQQVVLSALVELHGIEVYRAASVPTWTGTFAAPYLSSPGPAAGIGDRWARDAPPPGSLSGPARARRSFDLGSPDPRTVTNATVGRTDVGGWGGPWAPALTVQHCQEGRPPSWSTQGCLPRSSGCSSPPAAPAPDGRCD